VPDAIAHELVNHLHTVARGDPSWKLNLPGKANHVQGHGVATATRRGGMIALSGKMIE